MDLRLINVFRTYYDLAGLSDEIHISGKRLSSLTLIDYTVNDRELNSLCNSFKVTRLLNKLSMVDRVINDPVKGKILAKSDASDFDLNDCKFIIKATDMKPIFIKLLSNIIYRVFIEDTGEYLVKGETIVEKSKRVEKKYYDIISEITEKSATNTYIKRVDPSLRVAKTEQGIKTFKDRKVVEQEVKEKLDKRISDRDAKRDNK